mmetsp:Transcript_2662/g.8015  ORF Transcript_2662/g.8015 Transcript_2662/m.8015 type:complete len:371 (-) Transcript_2662:211-1323(-)
MSHEVLLCGALEEMEAEALVAALVEKKPTLGATSAMLVEQLGGSVSALAALASRTRAAYAFEKYAKPLLGLGVSAQELAAALERVGSGDAVSAEDVEDERVRLAFERLMRGLGLAEKPREALDGDLGFSGLTKTAADELCKRLVAAQETVGATTARAIRGPTMPPSSHVDDSSSDDDEGPSADAETEALRRRKRRRTEPAVARKKEKEANPWLATRDGGTGDCDGKRESWMMTPPSELDFRRRAPTNVPVAKTRFGGGAVDKPAPSRDDPAARAIIDAAQASRGPSLLELHQQRQQREGSSFKDDTTGRRRRRDRQRGAASPQQSVPSPWSRDADLEAPAKLDPKAREELFASAKLLNTRFTSSVQTSFS